MLVVTSANPRGDPTPRRGRGRGPPATSGRQVEVIIDGGHADRGPLHVGQRLGLHEAVVKNAKVSISRRTRSPPHSRGSGEPARGGQWDGTAAPWLSRRRVTRRRRPSSTRNLEVPLVRGGESDRPARLVRRGRARVGPAGPARGPSRPIVQRALDEAGSHSWLRPGRSGGDPRTGPGGRRSWSGSPRRSPWRSVGGPRRRRQSSRGTLGQRLPG